MPSDTNIPARGVISDVLPGSKFKVRLEAVSGGREVLAHLSGKMRIHSIKLVLGDRVQVEMSPYDLTKCRIIRRE